MKKTILITGSTDGIGKQTALRLAEKGNYIIIHGKDEKKCKDIVSFIRKNSGNKYIEYICIDLAEPENILNFKNIIKNIESPYNKLQILYNNAGVFMKQKIVNSKGYELTFMINYLAVYMISLELFEILIENSSKKSKARIINVASMAHATELDFTNLNSEKYFDPYTAYSYSKLEDIMFTFEFDRILKEDVKILEYKNITINTLHPGVISTKLLHSGWSGGANVDEGAKRLIYMLSDELENVSGKYFYNMKISNPALFAYNIDARKKLWEISERLTGIRFKNI